MPLRAIRALAARSPLATRRPSARRRAAIPCTALPLEPRLLLAATPVAIYHFDEGSGLLATDSAGANDGTLTGDREPTWVTPGRVGAAALSFDGDSFAHGTGSRVDTANLLTPVLGGTASLTAWIKTEQLGNSPHWNSASITGVEREGNGDDVYWGNLQPDGTIAMWKGDGAPAISTTRVNDGQWHHVAFTRDADTGEERTYVDGVLEATTFGDRGVTHTEFRAIGATTDVDNNGFTVHGYNYFNGQLDEVLIADRVLAPQEVASLAAGTTPAAPDAPSGLHVTAATSSSITVAWTDNSSNEGGFQLERSVTGMPGSFSPVGTAGAGATSLTDHGLAPGTQYFYRLQSINVGGGSAYTATVAGATTALSPGEVGGDISFAGFSDADQASISFNGSASADGTLRLTDNVNFQAGSAFPLVPMDVGDGFDTHFDFQIPAHSFVTADGIAFVMQSNAPTALGGNGGGLGYGGMDNSAAVKFDLWPAGDANRPAGYNATGLYTGGQMNDIGTDPANPQLNGGVPIDPASGIVFDDGSVYHVTLHYQPNSAAGAADGRLVETVTNTSNGASFTVTYTGLDLRAAIGSGTAFVGFTGGTGGASAQQDILNWTFEPAFKGTAVPPPPQGYSATPVSPPSMNLSPGAAGVTELLHSVDDQAIPIDLGTNTFNLYGRSYTGNNSLFVSSNGLITFGAAMDSPDNVDLSTGPGLAVIAPLWDDWITFNRPEAGVLTKFADTNADGTPDCLVLQWNVIEHFGGSPSEVTFQAILALNTGDAPGDVVLNFPDLDTGDINSDGASASVGLRGDSGQALPLSFNSHSDLVGTGKAVLLHWGANAAPHADAGPPGGGHYQVGQGGIVRLDGSNSSDANQPASTLLYEWDLDGNGVFGEPFGFRGNEIGPRPDFFSYGYDGPFNVRLRVTDAGHLRGTGSTVIDVVPNQAPNANAGGPYYAGAGGVVTLDASATTDDEDPAFLIYCWDVNGDGGFDFYGQQAQFTPDGAPGTDRQVTLYVFDSANNSATATATVHVVANMAPIANAGGPYRVIAGQQLQLDASRTADDERADSLTYDWDLDGDQAFGEYWWNGAARGDEHGEFPNFESAGLSPGTYPIAVRVTDRAGNVTTATTTITVAANTHAPVVNAGGTYTVTGGGGVYVFAQATDADEKPNLIRYEWDLDGDGVFGEFSWNGGDRGDENGQSVVFSAYRFNGPRTLTVAVHAIDSAGNVGTGSVVINVLHNLPPVVDAGPPFGAEYTAVAGTSVLLDASGTFDPDDFINYYDYQWDLDGNGIFGESGGARGYEFGTYTYFNTAGLQAGDVVTVALQVTDQAGNVGTDTATIRILPNLPPVANAGGPYDVVSGLSTYLNASGTTDPDDAYALQYVWDFDGNGIYGEFTQYGYEYGAFPLYTPAGIHGPQQVTVKLRVIDSAQNSSDAEAIIRVAPNQPPVADAGGPYTAAEGHVTTLDASRTTDPDEFSGNLFYEWDLNNDGFFGDAYGMFPQFSAANLSGGSSYPVHVRVTDAAGNQTVASATVNVTNTAPVLDGLQLNSAPEGGASTLSGNILDTTADHFTLDINWGDGHAQTVSVPDGQTSFAVDHVYADDGHYTPALRVSDADGSDSTDPHDRPLNVLWVGYGFFPSEPGVNITHAYPWEFQSVSFAGFDVIYVDPFNYTSYYLQQRAQDLSNFVSAGGGLVSELGSTYYNPDYSWVPNHEQLGWQTNYSNTVHLTPDAATHRITSALSDGGLSNGYYASQLNTFGPTAGMDVLATDAFGQADLLAGGFGAGRLVYTGLFPSNNWFYFQDFRTLIHQSIWWAGGNNGAGLLSADVANVVPDVQISGDPAADEGAIYTLHLSAADPGADTINQWMINWGDGNVESVAGNPSAATHRYGDNGAYHVSATATDEDGTWPLFGEAGLDLVVNNVAPTVTGLSSPASVIGGAKEGTPLNLSGAFTDPGFLDTHGALIDWGDGSTSGGGVTESRGAGSVAASHVYATGGVYTATLTVTDDDRGTASRSIVLYVSGAGVHDGVLQVIGTGGADNVTVNPSGGKLLVHAGFLPADRLFGGSVTRILVLLGAGNDSATVAGAVTTPVTLDGGDGDDQLNGGNGPNVIVGGAGNDMLVGGSGRDVLVGGLGADRIVANGGDDILVGGYTRYDADYASLAAISAEWNRADRTYSQRISDLRSGGGLNGSVVFNNGTVFDDRATDVLTSDAVDMLTGGEGNDWFVSNFAGAGNLDKVTDLKSGEVESDVV